MSDQPISDNPAIDPNAPDANADPATDQSSATDDTAVVEQPAPEVPAAPATNWADHPAGGLTGLYEYFSGELASLKAQVAKLLGSSGQA